MPQNLCYEILVVFIIILLLLLWTNKEREKILAEKEKLLRIFDTFTDADDSIVYIKDQNLNYVYVNKAFEKFYRMKAKDIIGKNDFDLSDEEFAKKRRETDLVAMEKGSLVIDEEEWNGRVYRTRKFPIRLINGERGLGAYKLDITEERRREKLQNKQLKRQIILAEVLSNSFSSRGEQLTYVLEEALKLTSSEYGHIYYYDGEKGGFVHNYYSQTVFEDCRLEDKSTIRHIDNTGLWGHVLKRKKPIIINDFDNLQPHEKKLPEGHISIKRFMAVPITIDNNIVAVLGLANKNADYCEEDVYEMTLLMTGISNAVERREAQVKLLLERNKYLQTLFSIGDGVMVVDKNGHIEILNQVAENLTGWSFAEAQGKHYKEVFDLSHEEEGMSIKDPIEEVIRSNSTYILDSSAILTSRDGQKYYIEDSTAPIKNEANETVGVVLVFRDVTEKIEQRRQVEYLSFHDTLTGLYNRRFFEEELRRLDTARNLPLSIIMGDVNGLKLTNDIFGHTYGDALLKKVGEVLRRACRSDDIIARWGGDEFILLLPKTSREIAEKIIERIKGEFSKESVKAIKCSISMGADTKENVHENIYDILEHAEDKMYAVKTLDNDEFKSSVIETIITTLHETSYRQKKHSFNVSELSQKLGEHLGLSQVDIRKLKEAAFLHDIGKIVLDNNLSQKASKNSSEWNDMKKHSIVGYRILNSFENTMDLAESVLAHHEHWDGSGYPKGLKGEEIPILARIISIVDAYDGLLYDSQGRKVMSEEEAINIIRYRAGIEYDPALVKIFENMIKFNLSN